MNHGKCFLFSGWRRVCGRGREWIAPGCLWIGCGLGLFGAGFSVASVDIAVLTTSERAAAAHEGFLASRRERMAVEFDPYAGPPVALVVEEGPAPWEAQRHPWHYRVRATVFWVGEKASPGNPVSNIASSWDPNWQSNFGGYDHPFKRSGYRPAAFEPQMNPFYVALPYNDLDKSGRHRPEPSGVHGSRSYRCPRERTARQATSDSRQGAMSRRAAAP